MTFPKSVPWWWERTCLRMDATSAQGALSNLALHPKAVSLCVCTGHTCTTWGKGGRFSRFLEGPGRTEGAAALCQCAQGRCKVQPSRPQAYRSLPSTNLGLLQRAGPPHVSRRGASGWLRGEVGQPTPEDAPQPPSPPTRRDRERCSLPAAVAAGMSQRRRHHRRRRPRHLHRPPQPATKERTGGGGVSSHQPAPRLSDRASVSMGVTGGSGRARGEAGPGAEGRPGRGRAGKVKVRGGAPGAGIGRGPCLAPERKVDPSQNPHDPSEDEGRCYPDHHTHPALALRGAQACVYTRAHRGVEAAEPAGSWRASGYPERAVALCPETTHELSQTAENHPQIKSSCSWLMLGACARKSNLLQQMFTERIRCALHSSPYQQAKMFAPQGPGSPRFLIMGAQIPPPPKWKISSQDLLSQEDIGQPSKCAKNQLPESSFPPHTPPPVPNA